MRGTWFIDGTWQPLEENYSVQIEKEHLTFFRGHKLPSEKLDPKASVPSTKIRRGYLRPHNTNTIMDLFLTLYIKIFKDC